MKRMKIAREMAYYFVYENINRLYFSIYLGSNGGKRGSCKLLSLIKLPYSYLAIRWKLVKSCEKGPRISGFRVYQAFFKVIQVCYKEKRAKT